VVYVALNESIFVASLRALTESCIKAISSACDFRIRPAISINFLPHCFWFLILDQHSHVPQLAHDEGSCFALNRTSSKEVKLCIGDFNGRLSALHVRLFVPGAPG